MTNEAAYEDAPLLGFTASAGVPTVEQPTSTAVPLTVVVPRTSTGPRLLPAQVLDHLSPTNRSVHWETRQSVRNEDDVHVVRKNEVRDNGEIRVLYESMHVSRAKPMRVHENLRDIGDGCANGDAKINANVKEQVVRADKHAVSPSVAGSTVFLRYYFFRRQIEVPVVHYVATMSAATMLQRLPARRCRILCSRGQISFA